MVGYSWHWIENWRCSWSEWDGCARQMVLLSFDHRLQRYASWSLPLQIRWYCERHYGKAHLQNTKGVLDEDIRYAMVWVWRRRHCGEKLCVWTSFSVTMNYNLCVKRVYQVIPATTKMQRSESVNMQKNKTKIANNSLYHTNKRTGVARVVRWSQKKKFLWSPTIKRLLCVGTQLRRRAGSWTWPKRRNQIHKFTRKVS